MGRYILKVLLYVPVHIFFILFVPHFLDVWLLCYVALRFDGLQSLLAKLNLVSELLSLRFLRILIDQNLRGLRWRRLSLLRVGSFLRIGGTMLFSFDNGLHELLLILAATSLGALFAVNLALVLHELNSLLSGFLDVIAEIGISLVRRMLNWLVLRGGLNWCMEARWQVLNFHILRIIHRRLLLVFNNI